MSSLGRELLAVIGATEAQGSVGRAILRNRLVNPFGGTVFPVNPGAQRTGIKSYQSVTAGGCRLASLGTFQGLPDSQYTSAHPTNSSEPQDSRPGLLSCCDCIY